MDMEELTSLDKPRQPPGLTLIFCLASLRSRQGSRKRNTKERDEDSREGCVFNEDGIAHILS